MGRKRQIQCHKEILLVEKKNFKHSTAVGIRDRFGESQLMKASKRGGSMEQFDKLLEHSDVHDTDNAGNTILSVAVVDLQTEKVRKLLLKGANVEVESGYERNRMIHDVLHRMFSTPNQTHLETPHIRKEVLTMFKYAIDYGALLDVQNVAKETGLSLLEKFTTLEEADEVKEMWKYYYDHNKDDQSRNETIEEDRIYEVSTGIDLGYPNSVISNQTRVVDDYGIKKVSEKETMISNDEDQSSTVSGSRQIDTRPNSEMTPTHESSVASDTDQISPLSCYQEKRNFEANVTVIRATFVNITEAPWYRSIKRNQDAVSVESNIVGSAIATCHSDMIRE